MIVEIVIGIILVAGAGGFFAYRKWKPEVVAEVQKVEAEIKVIDHSLSKVANTISRMG